MQSKLEFIHNELFSKEKWGEAATQFELLIGESPAASSNPLVRFNLAQCYIRLEQWSFALIQLKQAEELYVESGKFDDQQK
jgi:hypothetical protein